MSTLYNKTALSRETLGCTPSGSPEFLIKDEFTQPSGSFKSRGIGYFISESVSRIRSATDKVPHVYCSSGGNAGLAAATASDFLGIRCTVVVPITTKASMVSKIKCKGAEVIVKGGHWKEADLYLCENIIESAKASGIMPIYVHPFDNPEIWDGHSSIIDEIVSSLAKDEIPYERIKGIVCSVGGGGLFNGIIRGLERHNLAGKIPVIAVETKGCEVLNLSLKAGHPIVLQQITSVASSLGSVYVPQATFDYAAKYNTKSVVLNDADVLESCIKYSEKRGIAVEPSCGASLHLAYNPNILEEALNIKLGDNDLVVVVACGGSAMTTKELHETLAHLKHQKI